ncbi:MAG: metal ABC transporter permease, partial [SAR202 cluster bacterium]|nr:metal ABC transporter permease [SAR202 cluster bacterium]
AVTIVVAMQAVGVLLVGALMVIPTMASLQLGLGFRPTVVAATLVGLLSVLVGLTAAYFVGLPAGGAIVLACIGALPAIAAGRRAALAVRRR